MIGDIAGQRPDLTLEDAITHFFRFEPQLQQMLQAKIYGSDPLMMMAAQTKRQFPAGIGDVLQDRIVTTTRPTSADGRGWTKLAQAAPNYLPGMLEPRMIRYGSRKVESCLSGAAFQTPYFNVLDLTFQVRREQQMAVLFKMLEEWTPAVQREWYRYAFRSVVPCVVLAANADNPSQIGEYPKHTKPASNLNVEHMDSLWMRLRDEGATLTPFSMVDGAAVGVCFIGASEFRALELSERKRNLGLGAALNNDVVIEKIGKVRVIGNFVYIAVDYPPRFGDAPDGGYVQIDSHVEVATTNGHETVVNPDYNNPAIAKYSESIIWHQEAAHWLMAPDFTGWGPMDFDLKDFNGNFKFSNLKTEKDPLGNNACFIAQYANGIHPQHPKRAMAVLSRAVHLKGQDFAECYTSTKAPEPVLKMILERSFGIHRDSNDTNNWHLKLSTEMPAQPDGTKLALVSQNGKVAAVTVAAMDLTGFWKSYSGIFADASLAVDRACDPWIAIGYVPLNAGPVALPQDCVVCADPNSVPGAEAVVCDYFARIEAPEIANIRVGATNLSTVAGFTFPYSNAADLEAALTGYAGTPVAVAKAGSVWEFDAPSHSTNWRTVTGSNGGTLAFTRTNCVPAPAPVPAPVPAP